MIEITLVVNVPLGNRVLTVGGWITPKTKIIREGKAVKLASLKAGERVRISFQRIPTGDKLTSHDLKCVFTGLEKGEKPVKFTGKIKKYGVDLGYQSNAIILWAVASTSEKVTPGAMAGDYYGATAEVAWAAGLGANVLVGGSKKGFALQPISVEGLTGLNVAAGVAEVELKQAKQPEPAGWAGNSKPEFRSTKQARISKLKSRNKFEWPKGGNSIRPECERSEERIASALFGSLLSSSFGFVSNFDIRVSSLTLR